MHLALSSAFIAAIPYSHTVVAPFDTSRPPPRYVTALCRFIPFLLIDVFRVRVQHWCRVRLPSHRFLRRFLEELAICDVVFAIAILFASPALPTLVTCPTTIPSILIILFEELAISDVVLAIAILFASANLLLLLSSAVTLSIAIAVFALLCLVVAAVIAVFVVVVAAAALLPLPRSQPPRLRCSSSPSPSPHSGSKYPRTCR